MLSVRAHFPILKKKINGRKMVYFDNAATTQKPAEVIEAETLFYSRYNANVHRSLNPLAEKATKMYEEARQAVARFIHAPSAREVIFTRNTTEGINIVAKAWAKTFLKKDDVIVLPLSEHHSNIVPWLQLKNEIGIKLEYIPLDQNNERLDIKKTEGLLNNKKTKLLSIAYASNVLGIVNQLEEIVPMAKSAGVITVVDAAQAACHIPMDVQKLGCDFLAFSGHKCFGPTGIGVLWGREDLLEKMPPFLGGGEMIHQVFIDHFTPHQLPHKFEAGTPHIGGAVGLHTALRFIEKIGWEKIKKHERSLTGYLFEKLLALPFIKKFGPKNANRCLPIAPFTVNGIHAHDVADMLGEEGIIVRAGHHCCQILHDSLGIPATVRASLTIYNTKDEIDEFFDALKRVYKKFQ